MLPALKVDLLFMFVQDAMTSMKQKAKPFHQRGMIIRIGLLTKKQLVLKKETSITFAYPVVKKKQV